MDAPYHPTFGDLLKHYRLIAGLTQEELAERAGLSTRGIADLERDVIRTPRRQTFGLLAAALELSPQDRAAFEGTIDRRRKPRATPPRLGIIAFSSPTAAALGAVPHTGTEYGSVTARRRMPQEQRRAWALAYLAANLTISPGEYIGAMGVDRKTALTDLSVLVDGGYIRVYGATRDRRYALRTTNQHVEGAPAMV